MNVLNNLSGGNNYNQMKKEPVQNKYKPDIMDVFSEKVVNKRDLTDMVTVPRTIFKGYLCFTAGTAVNAIGALIKNNKISKSLVAAGSLLSIYGTYNFVKPYLIKGDELTKNEK